MQSLLNTLLRHLVKLDGRLLTIASVGLIGISSYVIYALEPQTFGSPFNGFWWVMTTVTTVGYGDFYPRTTAGKLLGIFLYIFGIALISIIISKLVDSLFIFKQHKEAGKLKFTGSGHFVIIEWCDNTVLAIQEILETDDSAQIVLIDELERSPVDHENVHYIRGNPIRQQTLESANLSKARAVFIFSKLVNDNGMWIRDSALIDGKTLLTASAIRRHYKHIYMMVEIRERENLESFTHVKVDEFIHGNDTVSKMAVRSAFNPGASSLVSELLTRHHGEDLYEIPKRPRWIRYRDAFEDLLSEGATLISDGEKMNINRRLDERIPPNARLFVICDNPTYRRITSETTSD